MKPPEQRSITVLSVGCEVVIGDYLSARITGIWIRNNGHVSYECGWWDGRNYHSKWLDAFEVKNKNEVPVTEIGFVRT